MKKPHFLISHEDYWSIWIGGFVLFLGLFLFFRNAPEDYVAQHKKFEAIQATENAIYYNTYENISKLKYSTDQPQPYIQFYN